MLDDTAADGVRHIVSSAAVNTQFVTILINSILLHAILDTQENHQYNFFFNFYCQIYYMLIG